MRILILGGTTEASELAVALSCRADIAATLSYAGRTNTLKSQPIPVRVGGFGGIDGLCRYLRDERIDLLVDATHPFAERISANAAAAAAATATPVLAFSRAAWSRVTGDSWIEVADNEAALTALGASPKRVFLTIGRLGIADFRSGAPHWYLIRAIDPPPPEDLPARHQLLLARGTFSVDNETALMRTHAIDALVTKNSGGEATYAKIAAARALQIPVVMVTPPVIGDVPVVHSLAECLEWIEAHHSTASVGTERRV
jgi:precorrin-6A/cobalt-precorrin-6A reductase